MTPSRLLAALALAGGFALAPSLVVAMEDPPADLGGGIRTELIGRWEVDKLNHVLTVEAPEFFGVAPAYTPATNAVRLYRITYDSVIPEHGNAPTVASGLLAVPEIDGRSTFPLVSYQHGTVYGKLQVPSFPEQSAETALMLAQFAGQGYVVIGADYFGLGTSAEPEGYMVKASHQQATFDMLTASRAVLAAMGIATPKTFLAGWSQGGFVTMAFLDKLEASGVVVDAAATASAPLDILPVLQGFLDFPRPNDADWAWTLFVLSAFSFEHYYDVPGLARSLINDGYYDISLRAYERKDVDKSALPADLKQLIRPEYYDARTFAASAFGRLAAATQAYRWVIRSPVRNYYGEADEAITVGIGQIAATYQHAMGSGNMQVEAVSTGKTDHRGTFATAVPKMKIWFDGL